MIPVVARHRRLGNCVDWSRCPARSGLRIPEGESAGGRAGLLKSYNIRQQPESGQKPIRGPFVDKRTHRETGFGNKAYIRALKRCLEIRNLIIFTMSAGTPSSPTGSKPISQTYEGGCHCGRVKYVSSSSSNVQPPLTISPDTPSKPPHPYKTGPVTSCNCSICHINGYLMVYPLESNITWHSGRDNMTSYTFGQKRIAHTFCTVCGTSIGGKSTDPNFFADNRALNVRTLKNVDVEALKFRKVDGRSR